MYMCVGWLVVDDDDDGAGPAGPAIQWRSPLPPWIFIIFIFFIPTQNVPPIPILTFQRQYERTTRLVRNNRSLSTSTITVRGACISFNFFLSIKRGEKIYLNVYYFFLSC